MTDAHEVLKVYSVARRVRTRHSAADRRRHFGFEGKRKDRGFYGFSSFTYPGTVYRYDFATGKSAVFRQPKVDFTPSTTRRRRSSIRRKDGTKIPMFITARKGIKHGRQNPTYPLRLWRLQHLADAGVLAGDLAWMERAESSRSRTCAAAANTARSGTTPAGSRRSRTSSTTSSPPASG